MAAYRLAATPCGEAVEKASKPAHVVAFHKRFRVWKPRVGERRVSSGRRRLVATCAHRYRSASLRPLCNAHRPAALCMFALLRVCRIARNGEIFCGRAFGVVKILRRRSRQTEVNGDAPSSARCHPHHTDRDLAKAAP